MKKLLYPLEAVSRNTRNIIGFGFIIMLMIIWFSFSFGTRHLFPTPSQVINGFGYLFTHGLIRELGSSITLCFKAVVFSVVIACLFGYASTMPVFKPLGKFVSVIRYLPLVGLTFYMSIPFENARVIQVSVLVMFMTTFLTTCILQMIQDIPQEEYDHAKTLGCSKWEVLWEVVILGRIDYVIELVRQNLAIVWVMLVSVETGNVANGGLGILIFNGNKIGDAGVVIAAQIVIILTGLLIDFALTKTRQLTFRFSKF